MKRIILILALILLAGPARADWAYGPDEDGDVVLLLNTPCNLDYLPNVELLRAAVLKNKAGKFRGCWTLIPPIVGVHWEMGAGTKGWKIPPASLRKVTES